MFYIQDLHAKGFSIRAIARMTGHDRKTIRKYINAQQAPRYKPRPHRPSKLDPFKPHLVAHIREGMLNYNILLGEIRAQGYGGGKSILKAFEVAHFLVISVWITFAASNTTRDVDGGLPGLSLYTGNDDVPLGKVRHIDGPLPLAGIDHQVSRLKACSERKNRGDTGTA